MGYSDPYSYYDCLIEIGVKIGYFHTFPKQKYRKD